ncbi:hypothetical protein ZWY2020_024417, partial [Hordeum vulgare]
RLAHIITEPETGLCFLLGKCKALETLYLEYVIGYEYRTPLTDVSLKALALSCPMLQVVELTFTFCEPDWPTEIGFTEEGIVALIQSCPIRALLLNGASILYDEGMEGLICTTIELVDCMSVTDAGINLIIQAPCMSSSILRKCENMTDRGIAELARSQKLESLTVIGCRQISQEGVHGAAKSVRYSAEIENYRCLKGITMNRNRKRRRSP